MAQSSRPVSFILPTKEDAERFVDKCYELIEINGLVTLIELKELIGITGIYYDAFAYWKSIDPVEIRQVRDGWLLEFPQFDTNLERPRSRPIIQRSLLYSHNRRDEMADWQGLLNEVEEQATAMKRNADAFEENMIAKIEAAKQDELLSAVKALGTRLDKIEKKLSEEDSVTPSQ